MSSPDGAGASQTLAVIDFETTGMSPGMGARATEIAAVLVRNGQIVGRYQSLMRSGAWVPPFITQLTGISNAMLEAAPAAAEVMREVGEFIGDAPLVAHNAAFDRGFWRAECERADVAPPPVDSGFACTLLLARRLYPEAPNHRLGTLKAFHELPDAGRAHRALADAEVTAHLLLRMQRDVERRFEDQIGEEGATHALLLKLQRAPRQRLGDCVRAHRVVCAA
ncbi:3'-5' exonuclease [Rivibacter subsaxonicus]|uniref:DNA-directed DNA polymerase n=1 Tax=Rivibacter subsaxonicus TaxID=457575 RepID=A0A4Q7VW43_9BURK|nr:3'-5' exonuclease [Rivibacter subsaxonicus]RZU00932.1 DNA polymerase-3 subunit epsilon [Rivibacter subsaxonicus]